MEHDFWHSKWHKNEIGFHEPEGNALLVKYADTLLATTAPRVFVPLCGKTKDIHWLLANGCEVVGAELSEIAITQLFAELDIEPEITTLGSLKLFQNGPLSIFVGDIFELTNETLGGITGIYDRAALVALPTELREKYAAHICDITECAPILLISFDYDQSVIPGPPFCVDETEVARLYNASYSTTLLEREPLEGGLKGKVAADSLVFNLKPEAK
ncbi:thiopurine S-methyltransferase [Alteromonas stellipolaris]|uniref:thiopurine S-methyltransferase n=1 Tax=Alteromonas stellipolaris TaxID=233316 RepID=UPI002117831D|nr:thiopurine S-methyltransferase [Alteromonas stellipolaris]MCQ8847384.1 thiopurine S-methyltransferase [Alteromonas stellipolaris]